MSYSLSCPCNKCIFFKPCIDRNFIGGAINGIHGVNEWDSDENKSMQRGHWGSGSIEIKCSNFQQKPEVPK
jgi:hypothetical protein